MATALSPEVHLMRRRVRHIHIPDLPPIYAPRSLSGAIRDHIQGQITRQRAVAHEPPLNEAKPWEYGLAKITSGVPTSFTSWVKQAGPPPTVLSFTRRPTYILPKHQVQSQEPWQVEYLTKALKSRMNIHFPEPPWWSSLPWRPFWEREMAESGWKHDPLNHDWPDVGVLIMPCAEAMFLGPGQVSIWPIIDLKDDIQRGSTKFKTKYEYERILEDTTIEVLKREFGIQAFAIPGSTGVWVESRIPPPEVNDERNDGNDEMSRPESFNLPDRRANVRRIATVHTSITDDITQWGVSIHVGQPDPTLDSWTSSTNPWTPIRQHNTTTSIAAELAHMKSSPSPLGPSKYLFTYFNQNAMPARAGQGAMPYSLIKADTGRRSPAPLGMDNRDISTAWTYEFARQLGMKDGHVDHYSMVEADDRYETSLPTSSYGAGFRFKGVFSEDVMNSSYRQVDVPHILVGKHEKVASDIVEESMRVEHKDGRIDSDTHDGWLLSWPLWRKTLCRKLDEAICGGPSDTRLKVYGMQKQVSSRLQRRRNELRQVKQVEDEWRAEMPHLVRRPLSDENIRELADRSREMERILKTVRIGTKSVKLLDSTIQIRRLLEKRFAGAFSRDADATEPEQSDRFSALEAVSDAPPTPLSARKERPRRSPRPAQPLDAAPPSVIDPIDSRPDPEQSDQFSALEAASDAPLTPLSKRRQRHQQSPRPTQPIDAAPPSMIDSPESRPDPLEHVPNGRGASRGESDPVLHRQVSAGEPVDPTEAKAKERIGILQEGVKHPARLGSYEFTKSTGEIYREKVAARARRAEERRAQILEAAKEQPAMRGPQELTKTNEELHREKVAGLGGQIYKTRRLQLGDAAEEHREAAGRQGRASPAAKDASEGTGFQWVSRDSKDSKDSRPSQFLPKTFQIGGS